VTNNESTGARPFQPSKPATSTTHEGGRGHDPTGTHGAMTARSQVASAPHAHARAQSEHQPVQSITRRRAVRCTSITRKAPAPGVPMRWEIEEQRREATYSASSIFSRGRPSHWWRPSLPCSVLSRRSRRRRAGSLSCSTPVVESTNSSPARVCTTPQAGSDAA